MSTIEITAVEMAQPPTAHPGITSILKGSHPNNPTAPEAALVRIPHNASQTESAVPVTPESPTDKRSQNEPDHRVYTRWGTPCNTMTKVGQGIERLVAASR